MPAGVQALELTWRQRVTDLKPGQQPWFDARIRLEFKDAAGGKLPGAPSAPNTRKSTAGWVERSARFLVPAGARTLEFMPALFQVEQGTFDLDDVGLQPVDAAPLQAAAAAAAAATQAKQAKAAGAKQSKAASALQKGAPLIANGDFETDKNADGWPDNWGRPKSGGSWVEAGGNHFLRLKSPQPGADIKQMSFIPESAQEDPYPWGPDMLGFIQKHRLHWTAFSFHPAATPVMIPGWDYAATPFWGAFVKRALAGEPFPLTRMR